MKSSFHWVKGHDGHYYNEICEIDRHESNEFNMLPKSCLFRLAKGPSIYDICPSVVVNSKPARGAKSAYFCERGS